MEFICNSIQLSKRLSLKELDGVFKNLYFRDLFLLKTREIVIFKEYRFSDKYDIDELSKNATSILDLGFFHVTDTNCLIYFDERGKCIKYFNGNDYISRVKLEDYNILKKLEFGSFFKKLLQDAYSLNMPDYFKVMSVNRIIMRFKEFIYNIESENIEKNKLIEMLNNEIESMEMNYLK